MQASTIYQEMVGRIKETDLSVPELMNGAWYYERTIRESNTRSSADEWAILRLRNKCSWMRTAYPENTPTRVWGSGQ
jgi:protease II